MNFYEEINKEDSLAPKKLYSVEQDVFDKYEYVVYVMTPYAIIFSLKEAIYNENLEEALSCFVYGPNFSEHEKKKELTNVALGILFFWIVSNLFY